MAHSTGLECSLWERTGGLTYACSLRSSTYQLLSSETNYTVFSTQSLKDRGRNYNNLESIHGTIHALTGNGGHMSYIPWSGFDPIFWLHHWWVYNQPDGFGWALTLVEQRRPAVCDLAGDKPRLLC